MQYACSLDKKEDLVKKNIGYVRVLPAFFDKLCENNCHKYNVRTDDEILSADLSRFISFMYM